MRTRTPLKLPNLMRSEVRDIGRQILFIVLRCYTVDAGCSILPSQRAASFIQSKSMIRPLNFINCRKTQRECSTRELSFVTSSGVRLEKVLREKNRISGSHHRFVLSKFRERDLNVDANERGTGCAPTRNGAAIWRPHQLARRSSQTCDLQFHLIHISTLNRWYLGMAG
jgi:hypothetical protein